VAASERDKVVNLLLSIGKIDVDAKDILSQTPLWWATENGHEEIVKLLQNTTAV
jgi:ankyrin repeat protein